MCGLAFFLRSKWPHPFPAFHPRIFLTSKPKLQGDNKCPKVHQIFSLCVRNCAGAGIARSLICRAIKRFQELGHEGDRLEKGRKRTVNTSKYRKIIKKRVGCNPMLSIRKVVCKMGINHE